MTVPLDVTGYVDLTLDDRDPVDVYELAIALVAARLPDLDVTSPAFQTSTEAAMLQAFALAVAEIVFALNRLPGALTEILLRLFDLHRDAGRPAAGTVAVTFGDTLGHDVDAGARFALDVGEALPVVLTSDVALSVPYGFDTGTVAVTATAVGELGNGSPAGTRLAVLDALPYVDQVTLSAPLAGGAEPEDGPGFLARASVRFHRLTDTLVLPEHFLDAASETPGVGRVLTLDSTDPGLGVVGTAPGHMTIAVLGSDGAALSGPAKTALQTALLARAHAGYAVHVIDPTEVSVDVTVRVTALPGAVIADVAADVEAAIRAYLSPAGWPWARTVRRNELVSLVDRVAGVDFVAAGSPTVPAADVALTGLAPLPAAGTVHVDVDAP